LIDWARIQKEFFGSVRWDSNGINTSDQMIRTIANTNIVKDATLDLGLEEQIKKRVNLGGVHYDDQSPNVKLFRIPTPSRPDGETIASLCLAVLDQDPECLSEFAQVNFLHFVDYLKTVGQAEEVSVTRSEGNQRFICGSGSRIINGFAAHKPPFQVSPTGSEGCSETNDNYLSSAGSCCLISAWSKFLIN
jgi:hypothetical protein